MPYIHNDPQSHIYTAIRNVIYTQRSSMSYIHNEPQCHIYITIRMSHIHNDPQCHIHTMSYIHNDSHCHIYKRSAVFHEHLFVKYTRVVNYFDTLCIELALDNNDVCHTGLRNWTRLRLQVELPFFMCVTFESLQSVLVLLFCDFLLNDQSCSRYIIVRNDIIF